MRVLIGELGLRFVLREIQSIILRFKIDESAFPAEFSKAHYNDKNITNGKQRIIQQSKWWATLI